MNWSAFYRQRAERFAQLLDEADGGRRHHVRSRLDTDLARPVAIGQRLRSLPSTVEVDPDFRAGLRAMLVATAEREGIGRTATTDPLDEETARPAPPHPRRGATQPALGATRRPIRARGAIVAGVAIGAIAVSGMSAASENAVPGDALYGMKRSTERAQLALASSDLNRGQLFLDFARTRLAEAHAVRQDPAGLTAVLRDMDADTRQGVKLLTAAAVQRGDTAALDVIDSFLAEQRPQLAALLGDAPRTARERVDASLALLDAVKRRAAGLRTSLGCATGPATEPADHLGPLPGACPESEVPNASPSTPSHSDESVIRVPGEPPRDPDGRAPTTRNSSGPPATPDQPPAVRERPGTPSPAAAHRDRPS